MIYQYFLHREFSGRLESYCSYKTGEDLLHLAGHDLKQHSQSFPTRALVLDKATDWIALMRAGKVRRGKGPGDLLRGTRLNKTEPSFASK